MSPLFSVLYHKITDKPFYANSSRLERGKNNCSTDILKKIKIEYSSLLKKKMGNISVLTLYQEYLNINSPQPLLSKSENKPGDEKSSPVTQHIKSSC